MKHPSPLQRTRSLLERVTLLVGLFEARITNGSALVAELNKCAARLEKTPPDLHSVNNLCDRAIELVRGICAPVFALQAELENIWLVWVTQDASLSNDRQGAMARKFYMRFWALNAQLRTLPDSGPAAIDASLVEIKVLTEEVNNFIAIYVDPVTVVVAPKVDFRPVLDAKKAMEVAATEWVRNENGLGHQGQVAWELEFHAAFVAIDTRVRTAHRDDPQVVEGLLADIASLTEKVQEFKHNFCIHPGCGIPIEWMIAPVGVKPFPVKWCKNHVQRKDKTTEGHRKHQPEPLSAAQMEENRLKNEQANSERRAKHSALTEQDIADNAAIVAATMANASFEVAHADKPGARKGPKVKRNKGDGKTSKASRGCDEEEFGEAAPKGKKKKKAGSRPEWS